MADINANASPVVEDKSASYQCVPGDNGKILVATGAITITLPAVADVWGGWNVTVYGGSDNATTVTAPSGKLVTNNNASATSVAFSTTSEKIGACVRIVYDSTLTKYLALNMWGTPSAS